MAVLKRYCKIVFQKKLKASSLVETLVATVIIVLMFAVASLTLNNVFRNTIKNNTDVIANELNYLVYQYNNQQIAVPYANEFEDWEISIQKTKERNEKYILFEAIHKKHEKIVLKKIIDVSE